LAHICAAPACNTDPLKHLKNFYSINQDRYLFYSFLCPHCPRGKTADAQLAYYLH
jgi:hypothetical protein